MFLRAAGKIFGVSGQNPRAAFEQENMRAALGSMERNSWASAWWLISARVPASSTPVGPPPTTTKLSGVADSPVSGLPLRQFKSEQHAAANFERVFNGLQAGSERLPVVVSEVGVARARGDDEVVVRNLGVRGLHDAAVEVESGDFRHEHFDILVRAKNGADRRGDLSRGKPGSGYLIEQRLKGVEILRGRSR